MLTFLRRIRKSLIESGSARKYIFYALGEITLVVIGILIALQINNWNEAHKNSILEEEFITNMTSDLLQDKVNLENVISQAKSKIKLFEIMLEKMPYLYKNDPSGLDTLFISAFDPIPTFFPIGGTFKSESSSGNMGIFRDKKYLSDLYKLYTNYDRLSGNAEDLDDLWSLRYEKYKHIRRTGILGSLTETDISELLDDIARCSKLLRYYAVQCNHISKELENVLGLKSEIRL